MLELVVTFLTCGYFFFQVSTSDNDPLVYVTVPKSQAKSFIYQGMPDTMVSVQIGLHCNVNQGTNLATVRIEILYLCAIF